MEPPRLLKAPEASTTRCEPSISPAYRPHVAPPEPRLIRWRSGGAANSPSQQPGLESSRRLRSDSTARACPSFHIMQCRFTDLRLMEADRCGFIPLPAPSSCTICASVSGRSGLGMGRGAGSRNGVDCCFGARMGTGLRKGRDGRNPLETDGTQAIGSEGGAGGGTSRCSLPRKKPHLRCSLRGNRLRRVKKLEGSR